MLRINVHCPQRTWGVGRGRWGWWLSPDQSSESLLSPSPAATRAGTSAINATREKMVAKYFMVEKVRMCGHGMGIRWGANAMEWKMNWRTLKLLYTKARTGDGRLQILNRLLLILILTDSGETSSWRWKSVKDLKRIRQVLNCLVLILILADSGEKLKFQNDSASSIRSDSVVHSFFLERRMQIQAHRTKRTFRSVGHFDWSRQLEPRELFSANYTSLSCNRVSVRSYFREVNWDILGMSHIRVPPLRLSHRGICERRFWIYISIVHCLSLNARHFNRAAKTQCRLGLGWWRCCRTSWSLASFKLRIGTGFNSIVRVLAIAINLKSLSSFDL